VQESCYQESQVIFPEEENVQTRGICKACYNNIAPKESTPHRKLLRQESREAFIQQGERMRKFAQEKANIKENLPSVSVHIVVRIKVDRVDRGTLDSKSVPGVISEVTEHYMYQVVCIGGVLDTCLIRGRFQTEKKKKVEHYELHTWFENWKNEKKIHT
jgi:hypothetical protein